MLGVGVCSSTGHRLIQPVHSARETRTALFFSIRRPDCAGRSLSQIPRRRCPGGGIACYHGRLYVFGRIRLGTWNNARTVPSREDVSSRSSYSSAALAPFACSSVPARLPAVQSFVWRTQIHAASGLPECAHCVHTLANRLFSAGSDQMAHIYVLCPDGLD